MALRFGLIFALGALLAGCGGPGPRSKSLVDPDPASKIPAIKEAAREKNEQSATQLVKDLDSDDPAVRFYAIQALQRLTGETFGYRYYDDEQQRKPALQKWNEWLSERKTTDQHR